MLIREGSGSWSDTEGDSHPSDNDLVYLSGDSDLPPLHTYRYTR